MEEFNPLKFVSSKDIDRERKGVTEARETILKDAERKFLNKQARQQEMIARGDDKWMLPQLDQQIEKSKKKKKKSKKEKKSKKSKKKKKSSSGSSSESEDQWVESGTNVSKTAAVSESAKDSEDSKEKSAKRDDWMDFGALATFSKKEIISDKEKARQEERKKREDAFALGKSKNELNPYYANGGDGLPTQDKKPTAAVDNNASKVAWLLKSFKRAEEQAKEQDVSIEVIAEKRWGSLENFNAMLDKAKGKTPMPGEQSRGHKKDFRARNRSRSREKPKFERQRSRSEERSKDSRERTDRKRSQDRQKSRSRDRSRDRRRSRSGERSSRRERSRERRSRSRSGGRSWRQKDNSEKSKPKFARPSEDSRKMNTGVKSYPTHSSGGSWKTTDRRDRERERDRENYRKAEEERKQKERKESSSSSSDSDSENAEEQKVEDVAEERPVIMSQKDLNALAAKLVKAEIMGNDEMAAQLKAKLTAAKDARAKIVADGGDPDAMEEQVEIVTKIKRDTPGMQGRVKKTKVETHEGGQRVRYFGDDDKYDLKQMFEREKMDTAEDQNGLFSRLAGKAEHERATDEWDMDDMIVDKAAGKQNAQQDDEKRVNKALAEQMSHDKTLEDCKWCIGSRRSNKHLMISMGKSVYLAVPGHTSLVEGHCLIVPMGHCSAATLLDEDVWQEVQEFRKALARMFNAQGEDCVFFETVMGLKKKPHMVIECVPMEREMGDLAPMYFQKAIQECETEWSNNKKLIKLKEKNISRSVPKGLPYFHVDFGTDCGFAHVIEDEQAFSRRFGHEIIGGMLDVEARTFRNPMWEQFDVQKQKVIGFGNMWKEYDWTKSLAAAAAAKNDSSSSDSD